MIPVMKLSKKVPFNEARYVKKMPIKPDDKNEIHQIYFGKFLPNKMCRLAKVAKVMNIVN